MPWAGATPRAAADATPARVAATPPRAAPAPSGSARRRSPAGAANPRPPIRARRAPAPPPVARARREPAPPPRPPCARTPPAIPAWPTTRPGATTTTRRPPRPGPSTRDHAPRDGPARVPASPFAPPAHGARQGLQEPPPWVVAPRRPPGSQGQAMPRREPDAGPCRARSRPPCETLHRRPRRNPGPRWPGRGVTGGPLRGPTKSPPAKGRPATMPSKASRGDAAPGEPRLPGWRSPRGPRTRIHQRPSASPWRG